MICKQEKTVLRDLAKRYKELAVLPVQIERHNRARDINDLKPRRPVVLINEIPWHEMDIDGKMLLVCKDPFARMMEWRFRSTLFRWEYLQADMVVEDFFPIVRAYNNSGIGLDVEEDRLSSDENNNVVSHHFKDQLDTMEKVMALKEPIITADKASDAERVKLAEDVLGEILPVKLRGHYIYHAPWDKIPHYRGAASVLMGLIDHPELMHATIKKWTDNSILVMKQMEAQDLLDTNIADLHCTPPYASDLKPGHKLENIWFRCMAQIFTEISPAMWKEFELDYVMPLTKMCGLTYYGCCEALEHKISMLRAIPNLRKVGVSPRANPESCAEQLGRDYVFAHKPNPAFVSTDFDRDTVKAEITRIIKTCKQNNCAYEFVLKDISTVSYKPANLIEWNKTVQRTIDEYYS